MTSTSTLFSTTSAHPMARRAAILAANTANVTNNRAILALRASKSIRAFERMMAGLTK